MSMPATKRKHSIEEFYRIENDATEKHEFWEGDILAMSGGTADHAKIAVNISGELRTRLKGKTCQPYSSDLRIRIPRQQRTTYPDVSVICGKVQLDPDDKSGRTAINPRVVVEVLSPSTEAYDRGEKFKAYRELESLREYVLVASDRASVETFLRQPDGSWQIQSVSDMQATVVLKSLDVELPMSEVYSNVEFPPPTPAPDDERDRRQ